MIDEHFMRHWNDGHARLSADIDRALVRIGRLLHARPGKEMIGEAYARRRAKTLFSGLAAVATTTTLLVTAAALATPAAGMTTAYVALA